MGAEVTDAALSAELDQIALTPDLDPELVRQLDLAAGAPPGVARITGPAAASAQPTIDPLRTFRDPNVDYKTGVQNKSLRYQYNLADSPKERRKFLDDTFGAGQWRNDQSGEVIISPQGMAKIGQPSSAETAFDESRLSLYDAADLGPDAPAIAAGTAAGIATGGLGFLPAMGLAGLATAGGKGFQEAGEALAGVNTESATEVAKNVGSEGLAGMAGEGLYRGIVRPVGRLIAGHPQGRGAMHVEPNRAPLLEDALEMGVQPRASSLNENWLLARGEGMLRTIFGDLNERKNAVALHKRIGELKRAAGPGGSKLDLGTRLKSGIKSARRAFQRDATILYDEIDTLSRGQELVPTAQVKAQASQLYEDIVKSPTKVTTAPKVLEAPKGKITLRSQGKKTVTGGTPVIADAGVLRKLKQIQELPDNMTFAQAQVARHELYRLWESPKPTQEIPKWQAKQLWKAFSRDIDDVQGTNPDVHAAIVRAKTYYREGIEKFDDAFIDRAAMSTKHAGAIDPEFIVDKAFRKQNPTKVIKLMRLLPNDLKSEVRRQAMDDIIGTIAKRDPNNVFGSIFSGQNFQKTLDDYGKETLNAMFGRDLTSELHKLASVVRLLESKKSFSSGLVAASIALHPVRNITKLGQLRIASKILSSKAGLRYLTTGLRFPKTRAGIDALARLSTMATSVVNSDPETLSSPQALE